MNRICSKFHIIVKEFRFISTKTTPTMKYLNVAEKNDAAKTIAGLLSNGSARRREGLSVYNKIYEFETPVRGKNSKMVMTSVSGHLLATEFLLSYKNWKNCNPLQLFDAAVRRNCIEDFVPIKRTLEREIKSCQGLIIWTDCDREGESIGFEIIEVCKAIKPNITVYRAKFSEITSAAVRRALSNLDQPNKFLNDAVNVRTELDLRTGAAITRLQTMRLQRLFPEKIANKLISYGSCQIPTLGFVVERYKEVEAFVSEPFWKIKVETHSLYIGILPKAIFNRITLTVTHTIDDLTVEFNWARNRLFDKESCEDFLMLCLADPKAKVENVTIKPKNKWRPVAMDTVEMEKLSSRKLKLSAKETMTIAEKLYTQGIISYPRTETNMFSKEINLRSLVEQHVTHSAWGEFATRVLEWNPNPRNGNKSDQAHPPIHPTKMVTHLTGNEGKVYELIVRHFLACISKDATGSETIVNIDIAGEKFNATGLCIYERNYLDVYIYEKWNAKQIHKYEIGQIFDPDEITMQEGATTAPPLLTEADLIALMEKHGIGTDATHADHISTIKERGYIGEADRGCLVPGVIGMGLYEAYDAMELVLAKPILRAEFEADLKKICLGEKDPKLILQEQIAKYKEAYKMIISKITAMDEKIAQRINETPLQLPTTDEINENENQIKEVFNCPKCQVSPMALRQKKTSGWFIGCLNFPDCRNAIWLPDELKNVSISEENCRTCGTGSKMLKFNLNAYYRSVFNVPDGWYNSCLRCDTKFRETFNINCDQVKQVGSIVSDSISSNHSRLERPNVNAISVSSRAETSNRNKSKTERTLSLSKTKSRTVQSKNKPTTANTQHTNIRTFLTSTTENTTIERERHVENMSDFFGCNDEFDDILGSADFDELTSNNILQENEADAAVALLINDDWEDVNWGSSNININTTPQAKRIRVESNESYPSTSINFHDVKVNRKPSASNPIKITQGWGSSSSYENNNGHNTTQHNAHSVASSVRCNVCKSSVKELTVKKDGPNQGRTFYVCSKQNPCKFFQWADESENSKDSSLGENKFVHREEPNSTTLPHNELVLCNCQLQANKLIVRKVGPNNGRWFYGCADKNKSCGFFKWCENDAEREETQYSWGSNPSTSASRTQINENLSGQSNRSTSTTNIEPRKRKCGICRQEGHTRSKCPRKEEFQI